MSTLPSRSSREAPPPVEMWLIFSAKPAFSTAATESPPPMMVIVPCRGRKLGGSLFSSLVRFSEDLENQQTGVRLSDAAQTHRVHFVSDRHVDK